MTSTIEAEGLKSAIKVHSFKWKRSMDNYCDTCTIILPAVCLLKDESGNLYENVSTAKQFAEGNFITIKCGYDGKNELQFRGFVSRINYKIPLEIECEGYSYRIKKVLNFNASYPKKNEKVTMRQILQDLVDAANADGKQQVRLADKIPNITIDTPVQFKNQKGTEVLEWFKTNLLQTVYFNFDELYVGLQQTEYKGLEKVILGWNTIKDDELSFKQPEQFTSVNIIMQQREKNGEMIRREQKEENSDRGKSQTKKIVLPVRVDENTLKAIAASEQAKVKYRGYEGTLTTFLVPYTQLGMALEISDKKYTDRKGTYLITGIEGEYGPNGGRVKVKIGNALSNQ